MKMSDSFNANKMLRLMESWKLEFSCTEKRFEQRRGIYESETLG